MSNAEDRLDQLRAARDAARATLTGRIDRAKPLATPAGLTKRVKQDLAHKARSVAVQAIEIASDNRGVVAATASALLLWFTRHQTMAGLSTLADKWAARKTSIHETKDDPA